MASSCYDNDYDGDYEESAFGIDNDYIALDQSRQNQDEEIYDNVSLAGTTTRPSIQPVKGNREQEGSSDSKLQPHDVFWTTMKLCCAMAVIIILLLINMGLGAVGAFYDTGANQAPIINCPSIPSSESDSISFDSPIIRNFPNPELVFISYSERGRTILTLPARKWKHELNDFKVGTTFVTAVASDSSLNLASCEFHYSRLPAIICPSSKSSSSTTASFPRPQTNFEPTTYYYFRNGKVSVIISSSTSYQYLYFFDRGESTIVTVSAVDDRGITAFCSFAVNVTAREGEVRLVGGGNRYEGRIEVYHDDIWGSVCGDSWDANDTEVVCDQLSYPDDDVVAHSGAYFGQGSGQIWLDNVGCSGSEKRLDACSHNDWGSLRSCNHSKDAGVVCTDGGDYYTESALVRLEGGSDVYEGRVEVLHNGVWGTVCGNRWYVQNAIVVCRQLGYPYGQVEVVRNSLFGKGTGEVWIDDVICAGTEERLSACVHDGWGVKRYFCDDHGYDAGVRCKDGKNYVRLVDGSSPFQGRVEILHNGFWGTVCSDFWDNTDALVVCRQLGFPYNDVEAPTNARFGQGTGYIWMDDVRCDTSDEQLSDCAYNGWGNNNCVHGRDAGVICK